MWRSTISATSALIERSRRTSGVSMTNLELVPSEVEWKALNGRVCAEGLASLSDSEVAHYNVLRAAKGLPSIQELHQRLRRQFYGRDDLPTTGERIFLDSRQQANRAERKRERESRRQEAQERRNTKARRTDNAPKRRGRPPKV